MDVEQQPNSLVCLSASELFPKKSLLSDDEILQVCYPVLSGEGTEFLTSTSDATVALSNFRLFINFTNSFLNIPLRLIESVELRDLFIVQINCKDARSFRIVFDSNEQSADWLHKLSSKILPYQRVDELFAFAYQAWCMKDRPNDNHGNCLECKGSLQRDGFLVPQYSFLDEVHRLGFETDHENSPWRITDANSNYEVCRTYPKLHIIPACIKDADLRKVASFRCSGRFPSVVWRHATNGAVIARCSQPEVGWWVWRNPEDERLLQAIGVGCTPAPTLRGVTTNGLHDDDSGPVESTAKQVLIVDARSYTAAYANRGKGGGFEYTEYYPNCEVMFMNLANIHGIRKSFYSLRSLCSGSQDITNWWSLLEKTNWLHHISMLIKAVITVVRSIHHDGRPVVVHCSDGWDRTTQVVALAELLLDPYYRTIEGFKVLIEREWLEFGHRFADRCGHGRDNDENERCPVFLQWLDCVHQLQKQFPCAFEFNESFLVKILHHTYSCLFGTFLCNNENERHKNNIKARTLTLWSYILPRRKEFRNLLYSPSGDQVLEPSYHIRSLHLWSAVYLAYPTPFKSVINPSADELANIASITPSSSRFLVNHSDSNLELKSSSFAPVNCSKSDGELATCSRSCVNDHLGSRLPSKECTDGRGGVCCRCRGAPITKAGSVVNGSMYYSMTADSPIERQACLDSSMSSSTATVVLEHSDASETNDGTVQELNGGTVQELNGGTVQDLNGGAVQEINGEVDPSGTAVQEGVSNREQVDNHNESCEGCTNMDASSYEDLTPHQSEVELPDNLDSKQLEDSRTKNQEDILNSSGEMGGCSESSLKSSETGNSSSASADTGNTSSPSTGKCNTSQKSTDTGNSSTNNTSDPDDTGTLKIPEPGTASEMGTQTSRNSSFASDSSTQTSISSVGTPNASTATQTGESLTTLRPNMSSILARYLDSDGLTTVPDPVQSRLRQIEAAYHAQMEALHAQLVEERRRRLFVNGDTGSPGRTSDLADEVCSLPDSTQSGDQPSLSCGSADEASWIQIDEREADPVRWVPDHAATNCANCDTGFWIANRKHHCRNCGQVFCSSCSDHKLPVPNEQLYDPVRVCVTCFGRLVSMETREKWWASANSRYQFFIRLV